MFLLFIIGKTFEKRLNILNDVCNILRIGGLIMLLISLILFIFIVIKHLNVIFLGIGGLIFLYGFAMFYNWATKDTIFIHF